MAVTLRVLLEALVLLHFVQARKHMNVLHQWKTPDYVFPSESVRQAMITNGSYSPGNPYMLDVDVWNRGSHHEVFVTTPRFLPGTPATLSVLSKKHTRPGDSASPLLEPYPSWSMNRQGDCNSMTSVLRIQVDVCGRLWVIDSGVVDLMTEAKLICPPQILVFDLRTSRLIRRYRIPQDNLEEGSLLINIAVDVHVKEGSCQGTFAYLADVTQHGLVVYDAAKQRSWRIHSSLFDPSPAATHFTISGESFELADGIFGLALSPIKGGDRTLYFHSLASFKESWVKASVLRKNSSPSANSFHESPGSRSSQTAATAMNNHAILFSSQLSNTSLNCWNSRLPYTSKNLVELVRDEDTLQFVSGMKVVRDVRGKETLWVVSCRFQKLMTGSFNANDVNFRIMTAPVEDLVKGTACEVKGN